MFWFHTKIDPFGNQNESELAEMFESISYTETSHSTEGRRLLDEHLRRKFNRDLQETKDDPGHRPPPRSKIRKGKPFLSESFELWHEPDEPIAEPDYEEVPLPTVAEQEKLDLTKESLKSRVTVLDKGVEFLPKKHLVSRRLLNQKREDPDVFSEYVAKGFLRYHVRTLFELMHLSVLKERWNQAYRCFALLIRVPRMDIRDFWTVGLKILKKRAETSFIRVFEDVMKETPTTAEQLENSAGAASFFTNQQLSILSRLRNPDFVRKNYSNSDLPSRVIEEAVRINIRTGNKHILEYLSWLSRFCKVSDSEASHIYPQELMNETPVLEEDETRKKRYSYHQKYAAPPYRAGTKNQPNPYIAVMMWELLVAGDLKRCKDMTSQLVLEHPYSSDGLYFFIQGMAHYVELQSLVTPLRNSGEYSDVEDYDFDDTKVCSTQLKEAINLCFAKAANLGFEYPKGQLLREMMMIDRLFEEKEASGANVSYQSDQGNDNDEDNTGQHGDIDSSDLE
ncbi:unnamed protein product [Kuraishia capsulata CBS 1993]|uniref:Uncharacterized protein n=1 Tax=Kuraishia capsulata CBS 1993 TaxID=1382522 RepID=W6MLK7_9ASCO|nr:uncharacterized protein KUCA_T00003354001 [Kuraishia capsulata CBS 1993]CDK27376.1 unnamed protein product [Kuraishia capsulata CBS 1993]